MGGPDGKVSREDIIKQDVADLHGLGYAQELFRSMGGFSNFAISFSIISILTGAVILYDYGLAWAGTAATLIGWPLVTIFVLCIAASMAEIASAYPTAGGLYYWASKMRNKNWGWWTAWFNLIGQFAIVAGINFAAAFFLNQAIFTPLTNGSYTNTSEILKLGDTLVISGQLFTMAILLTVELVLNIAGIRVVAILNQVSVWWHIAFVVLIVGCPVHPRNQEHDDRRRADALRDPATGHPGVMGHHDPAGVGEPARQSPVRGGVDLPAARGLLLLVAPRELDVHRLRRVGPCGRGDRRSPRLERVGHLHVGRRVGCGRASSSSWH